MLHDVIPSISFPRLPVQYHYLQGLASCLVNYFRQFEVEEIVRLPPHFGDDGILNSFIAHNTFTSLVLFSISAHISFQIHGSFPDACGACLSFWV